jgi:hypothetical protein
MNEKHLTIGLVALAAVLGFFAEQFTGASLQVVAVKIINAALLLGTSFALIKFTRGTQVDVIKEIFEEHNNAAALYIGSFIIALAIALTVNS